MWKLCSCTGCFKIIFTTSKIHNFEHKQDIYILPFACISATNKVFVSIGWTVISEDVDTTRESSMRVMVYRDEVRYTGSTELQDKIPKRPTIQTLHPCTAHKLHKHRISTRSRTTQHRKCGASTANIPAQSENFNSSGFKATPNAYNHNPQGSS